MGPPGLWAELRRSGAAVQLSGAAVEGLLEGKVVAVDGAVWLYEAQLQPSVVQAFGAAGATLKVVFERCARWLRKGVLPVLVLEGSGGGRAQRVFSRGHGALGAAFAPQAQVRALLDSLGVPWVNAEGEAEATCAALASAGACDFVATTDVDALLFGAPKVLRGLDLRQDGPSQCELWEATTIERTTGLDRRAMTAAAFLMGCDYDCRTGDPMLVMAGPRPGAAAREGSGIRGMGSRKAVLAARALRAHGRGDALSALRHTLHGQLHLPGDPAVEPSRAEASLDGGFSQDSATTCEVLEEEKGRGRSSTQLLARLISQAAKEPACVVGFDSVVSQYHRHTVCNNGVGPFTWRGISEAAAGSVLSQVYPQQAMEKLRPLSFEWALRRLSAECPEATLLLPCERRNWAACHGLPYVPLSAKRGRQLGDTSRHPPHALVDWALAKDPSMAPLQLPRAARSARLGVVEACGLLDAEATRETQCRPRCAVKVAAVSITQLLGAVATPTKRRSASSRDVMHDTEVHSADVPGDHEPAVGALCEQDDRLVAREEEEDDEEEADEEGSLGECCSQPTQSFMQSDILPSNGQEVVGEVKLKEVPASSPHMCSPAPECLTESELGLPSQRSENYPVAMVIDLEAPDLFVQESHAHVNGADATPLAEVSAAAECHAFSPAEPAPRTSETAAAEAGDAASDFPSTPPERATRANVWTSPPKRSRRLRSAGGRGPSAGGPAADSDDDAPLAEFAAKRRRLKAAAQGRGADPAAGRSADEPLWLRQVLDGPACRGASLA
mmetsp:Transcript_17005/g.48587  ORF Transcript_17005/g.48587 Transcript_17005/m.48587 type:complete len:785 (+) Transcript_17005:1100-3454(+)